MMRRFAVTCLLTGILIAGCSTGPGPIVVGRDQCMHCRMAIQDLRFASQYVTDKGKRFTFDAIECMVRSIRSSSVAIRSAWVADYEMSDTWVPVQQAVFLHSTRVHSPMGAGLAAFGPPATPSEIRQAYGGTVFTWEEVQEWVFASDGSLIASQAEAPGETPAD